MTLSYGFFWALEEAVKQHSRFVTVSLSAQVSFLTKGQQLSLEFNLGRLIVFDGTVSFACIWFQWMWGSLDHIVGIISVAAS